jgi:hypothetical protein
LPSTSCCEFDSIDRAVARLPAFLTPSHPDRFLHALRIREALGASIYSQQGSKMDNSGQQSTGGNNGLWITLAFIIGLPIALVVIRSLTGG